jgi:hypothetical protein
LDINIAIGSGIISRGKIERNNNWSEIIAANIFGFEQNVGIVEIAQVIPLRKELSIIELKLIRTEKRDDFNLGTNIWYEVELENIPENYKEYWSIK